MAARGNKRLKVHPDGDEVDDPLTTLVALATAAAKDRAHKSY